MSVWLQENCSSQTAVITMLWFELRNDTNSSRTNTDWTLTVFALCCADECHWCEPHICLNVGSGSKLNVLTQTIRFKYWQILTGTIWILNLADRQIFFFRNCHCSKDLFSISTATLLYVWRVYLGQQHCGVSLLCEPVPRAVAKLRVSGWNRELELFKLDLHQCLEEQNRTVRHCC